MVNLEFLQSLGFAKLVRQETGKMLYEIPFQDRMGFVFLFCALGMYIISMIENNIGVKPKGLGVDKRMFKTTTGFAIGALIIIRLLIALYTVTGKEMIKIGITSTGQEMLHFTLKKLPQMIYPNLVSFFC